jgi:hypothetical protein
MRTEDQYQIERKRQIEESEFLFILIQQVNFLLSEIANDESTIANYAAIKDQVEASKSNNYIVNFFIDDDTGELTIKVRPKPKMGFVK